MTSALKVFAVILTLAVPLSAAEPPVVLGFSQASTNAPLAGAVLLTELGCVNCHATAQPSLIGGKHGPDLRHAKKLKAGYLEAWLVAPQQLKPGTTMPDMLAGYAPAERGQMAADLAAYLRSLPDAEGKSAPLPPPDLAAGATFYHTVGCVACHSPVQAPPAEAVTAGTTPPRPALPSVPFGRLSDKYTVETLADFLRDPHAWRPAGRMPSFNLQPEEAASLAAWLLEKGPPNGSSVAASRRTGDAAAGRSHFQKLQCAACHDLPGDSGKKPAAKALAGLRWDAGCVASKPVNGLPHYSLAAGQMVSLRAATNAVPLGIRERMQANALALGCTACHVRDGVGGPELGRSLYFEGSGEDLGEEGRLPPRLTHAGYKIMPEPLAGIIADGFRLRPYFKTRMPAFGKTLAAPLAAAFEACDLPKNLKPLEQKGRNEAGRKLIGTTGLSCITCHPFNGHKSLGISAVDLVKTIPRLRPEWLAEFLKNPADFNLGTRMPSFWPDAKITKVQGDMDAIRVYLLEADQARLPDGLVGGQEYELIPSQRPTIFRSFIQGAGTHGVAVGFAQGVHAAFDAEVSNWTLAWKGRFLDAEGTWFDRANPPAVPLGTDTIALDAGPTLAVLENDQQPWPTGFGGADSLKFLGYRLDARGVPTFRYQFNGAEVTDRMEPSDDGRSLLREIKWTGGRSAAWVHLAAGTAIEPQGPGAWRVAGKWNVTLLTPGADQVRIRAVKGAKGQEAILAVPAGPAEKIVRLRIQW